MIIFIFIFNSMENSPYVSLYRNMMVISSVIGKPSHRLPLLISSSSERIITGNCKHCC